MWNIQNSELIPINHHISNCTEPKNKPRGLTASVVAPGIGEPAGHPDSSQNRGCRLNREEKVGEKGREIKKMNYQYLTNKKMDAFFYDFTNPRYRRDLICFLSQDMSLVSLLLMFTVNIYPFIQGLLTDYLFFPWCYKLPSCSTLSHPHLCLI